MTPSCSTPAPRSCWKPPASGPAAPTLEADGRYHIRSVIGPDEYHEGVDDNAYTNGMARWNLERGLGGGGICCGRAGRSAGRRCASGSGLMPAELAAWRRRSGAAGHRLDPTSGLIEQFAGFFGLEPLDLAAYAAADRPDGRAARALSASSAAR